MKRKQFTFYESFYQAIQCIGVKSQRADAYDAICAYALLGKEPDMDKLSPSVKIVMMTCMPILSAGNKKAEAAVRGAATRTGAAVGGEAYPAANHRPFPKKKVPMGSGELGEVELETIRKMMAEQKAIDKAQC